MKVAKKIAGFYRKLRNLVPTGEVYRDMSQHRGSVRDPELSLDYSRMLKLSAKKKRVRDLSELVEVEMMGQTMSPSPKSKKSLYPTPEPDGPQNRLLPD